MSFLISYVLLLQPLLSNHFFWSALGCFSSLQTTCSWVAYLSFGVEVWVQTWPWVVFALTSSVTRQVPPGIPISPSPEYLFVNSLIGQCKFLLVCRREEIDENKVGVKLILMGAWCSARMVGSRACFYAVRLEGYIIVQKFKHTHLGGFCRSVPGVRMWSYLEVVSNDNWSPVSQAKCWLLLANWLGIARVMAAQSQ